MLYEYLAEARLAELRRDAVAANIEKVIKELYGDTARGKVRIDPALYARYVWNGLHI